MPAPNTFLRSPRSGFTILEVCTVIVIVLLLIVLLFPAYQGLGARAGRAGCTSNLRALHVAADSYLQDHHTWPQIAVSGSTEQQFASAWIAAFRPYNLDVNSWVCPILQKQASHPDLNDPDNVRIDYIPSPFKAGQQYPYKWANQPWFIEKANAHGTGNLIIFPDGHVEDAMSVLARSKHHASGATP